MNERPSSLTGFSHAQASRLRRTRREHESVVYPKLLLFVAIQMPKHTGNCDDVCAHTRGTLYVILEDRPEHQEDQTSQEENHEDDTDDSADINVLLEVQSQPSGGSAASSSLQCIFFGNCLKTASSFLAIQAGEYCICIMNSRQNGGQVSGGPKGVQSYSPEPIGGVLFPVEVYIRNRAACSSGGDDRPRQHFLCEI
jgi:hypothetical protein